MSEEMFDIVDEDDHIIGYASRKEAHAKGLLHREINLFFVTPQKTAIFQRRSKTKAIHPGRLDATVGGHVEKGKTYAEAAIIETFEETGVAISETELVFLQRVRMSDSNPGTSLVNECFQYLYGYLYKGDLKGLIVEKGEVDEFVEFPLEIMFSLPATIKAQFTPRFVDSVTHMSVYEKLLALAEQ